MEREVLGDGDGVDVAGVEARRMVVDVGDLNGDVQRGRAGRRAAVVRRQMAVVTRHRLATVHTKHRRRALLISRAHGWF